MASVTIPENAFERAWYGTLKARLNVIYFERLMRFYEVWDKVLRGASLLLSSLGVGLAVKYGPEWLTVTAGGLAAVLSLLTMILQLPEKARVAGSMLPLYTEHHLKLKRLTEKGEAAEDRAVDKALAELDATAVMEAERIKAVDDKRRIDAQKTLHLEYGFPYPS